jgi:hypothetical protein
LELAALGTAATASRAADPPFALPKLPYAYDALEPYIDAQTMQIHQNKHHQAYVDNLNKGRFERSIAFDAYSRRTVAAVGQPSGGDSNAGPESGRRTCQSLAFLGIAPFGFEERKAVRRFWRCAQPDLWVAR